MCLIRKSDSNYNLVTKFLLLTKFVMFKISGYTDLLVCTELLTQQAALLFN